MQQSSPNSPILIYDRIGANRRKTRWLLAVLAVVSTPVFLFIAHDITGIIAMSILMQGASSLESAIAPIIGISTALAVILMGVAAELLYRYSADLVLRLTSARPLRPEEEPDLVRVVENLCIGAGLPKPRLAIIESASTNLYSTGMNPDNSSLVVTRGLLKLLDRQELEGVVAQELSQIGNGDVRLGTVLATLVTLMLLPFLIIGRILKTIFRLGRGCRFGCLGLLIYFGLMVVGSVIFGLGLVFETFADPTTRLLFVVVMLIPLYALFIGPGIGYLIQFSVSREHEFLADADAALLTRYPPGLTRALVKIGVPGNAAIETQQSITHLWIADPRVPRSIPRPTFLETHPPISERIDALSRMGGTSLEMIAEAEAAGREYRDAIAGTNEID